MPEPPLPELTLRQMTMRRAEPYGEDLRNIYEWMNADHVAPYWEQAWTMSRWQRHLEQMYAHTYERPYIVDVNGRPGAYIELYRAARDCVADHYRADRYDIGLHGAIGARELVGKNLAFLFWLDVIPAIFAAEPECESIITDPAASHPVAVRLDQVVADRVGGENLGEVELPHKRAVLFRFGRIN
ncbi:MULTISPECIES: GNAT family N-acetyltransferase [Gulosibacter]|uniref:GNAT family N-acetyltransferase n=1 Tax=Gulosibacter TaxID=256818 RepID=UPI0019185CBF|nr:GNAT family N-acetyltransferase [Gulosibacter hominis]